jgi:3-oxoacyl-[acyl-carrier protein] reductase
VDRYAALANSSVGQALLPRLGLPTPPVLRRYEPGQPLTDGPVLLGAVHGGSLTDAVRAVLTEAGCDVRDADDGSTRWGALMLDATGIARPDDLVQLHTFFSPVLRRLARSGRVLVLGRPGAAAADPEDAAAQGALEGFTRSVG